MDEKFDEQLRRVMEEASLPWATIGEWVDYCEARLPSPADEDLRREFFAVHIRRVIKQQKREDGLSEWESTVSVGVDGKSARRYKQLSLFDVSDFRQVSQYHTDRARYHGRKANTLVRRCKEVHKRARIEEPFPDWGFLDDDDAAVA